LRILIEQTYKKLNADQHWRLDRVNNIETHCMCV
jgi:hypothetical protein